MSKRGALEYLFSKRLDRIGFGSAIQRYSACNFLIRYKYLSHVSNIEENQYHGAF